MQSSQNRRLSGLAPASIRRISESSIPFTTSATTVTATTAVTSVDSQSMPVSTFSKTPLVMTPVSQLPRSPRKTSRVDGPFGALSSSWDPEQYNPDGSLRTMHRLPSFDDAYAQALNTRYIRHKERSEREKELSVNEIFANEDHH